MKLFTIMVTLFGEMIGSWIRTSIFRPSFQPLVTLTWRHFWNYHGCPKRPNSVQTCLVGEGGNWENCICEMSLEWWIWEVCNYLGSWSIFICSKPAEKLLSSMYGIQLARQNLGTETDGCYIRAGMCHYKVWCTLNCLQKCT